MLSSLCSLDPGPGPDIQRLALSPAGALTAWLHKRADLGDKLPPDTVSASDQDNTVFALSQTGRHTAWLHEQADFCDKLWSDDV
jgi:hypothetical protein